MTNTYPITAQAQVTQPRDGGVLNDLKSFLRAHRGKARIQAEDGSSVELPDEVRRVVDQAVEALADGDAVSVAPVSTRLTTSQAADVLGVTRPTLVKMLDDGKIPYEQINVHRTVLLSDVLAYKQSRTSQQRAFLGQTLRDAVADGTYRITAEQADQAIAQIRQERS
ncbi:MAG: helix-turn-helix domain-containing protein [Propionibacteriaceae bacterium]|nr:helix-turn-helix domain-containing protein [Propionibacteriaceae bacterium]